MCLSIEDVYNRLIDYNRLTDIIEKEKNIYKKIDRKLGYTG